MNANESLFPLAFAVVDAENNENGLWFLEHLRSILSTHVPTFLEHNRFREAVHGHCLRHLEENMHKTFKNIELKSLLGKAARTVTREDFQLVFQKMKELEPGCADGFVDLTDSKHGAEPYFVGKRYDHLTFNIAESLNAWLLSAREKPILAMFEDIRHQLMKGFSQYPVELGIITTLNSCHCCASDGNNASINTSSTPCNESLISSLFIHCRSISLALSPPSLGSILIHRTARVNQ